ncbi:hypothetical protein HY522_02050 [bacterium]|nr:hypothetical protein [bacterium]
MSGASASKPAPFALWQVLILLTLAFTAGSMALRAERLQRDVRTTAATFQPLTALADDLHADISKATTHLTYERAAFELHGLNGRIAKYYGATGNLVRESGDAVTGYPLIDGTVQLGLDHGMVIGRILWKGRLYLIGAPPGWAITREEMLSQ